MTEALQMAVLAAVQGLTEFLPVSSSGHLVLAQAVLGFKAVSGLGIELLLHGGTLVAVLLYYRKLVAETFAGLWRREREAWRFAVAVILSMIPAVAVGLCFEDQLEELAESPRFVCGALIFTGILLLATRRFGRDAGRDVSPVRGIWMGVAQAVAMLPGVSRSGSTIAMSRFLGVAPEKAAAFSFLMVVPVILGGNALHVVKALSEHDNGAFAGLTPSLALIGFIVSAAVGYASVAWMVRLLGRNSFWRFGFYCLAVGIFGGLFLLLRH